MIWEVVSSEVLGAINWGLWFVGLFVVTCGPILVGYACWTSNHMDFGETHGETGIYQPIDRSAVHDFQSTGDILDQCLTHRSKLQYFHRVLCHRAGINPDSIGPMADLISEAVYDGRSQYMCIKRVDEAIQERIEQHA